MRRQQRKTRIVRPSEAHLEELEDLTTSESISENVLNRGELRNLYDSDKWEFPWDRSQSRSWKSHRSTQYKS